MQGTADSLNEFFAFVEILLQLEEHLGSSIGDTKDFYDGRMLRDIARVVQLRLPPGPDSEAQSVKVVREAVLKVSREDLKRLQWDSAEEIPLDVPVFLAVYPEQWK